MLSPADLRGARRWTALGVILVLTVAACTSSGQTEITATTTGSGVPKPPPPAPIAPVLRRPGPPGDAVAGIPTLLGGAVLSRNPITRLELWNGSELVEMSEFDEPQTEVRTAWQWVPPEAGLFGLVLRAFDSSGGVATSFPLWVRAVAPKTSPTASAGRLPGGWAAPVGSGGVAVASLGLPHGRVSLAVESLLAPQVSLDEGSCIAEVSLPAVQDVSGIAVYAASFGSAGFVPVGLLPAGGGAVSLMMGAAPIMVYAESFDGATAMPGTPQVVHPPNPCAGKGWTGELVFDGGLMANPKGADRAYLYVSYDGSEVWGRAPVGDQSFVYPAADGRFDFAGLLNPSQPGATVHLEAWGWVQGTLTPLGRGSWASPQPDSTTVGGGGLELGGNVSVAPYTGPIIPNSDLDWNLGNQIGTTEPVLIRTGTICTYKPLPPTKTTTTTVPVNVAGGTAPQSTTTSSTPTIAILPDTCTNAPFGQYSKIFRWEPLGGGLTHGLLQVSTKPPPSDSVVSFPGLIYTKNVDKPAGDFVDFEVPLGDLIKPPVQTATLPNWEAMSFQMVENLAGLGLGGTENTYSFVPVGMPSTAPNTTFYLRVVPMQGTQILAGKSNAVVIDIDDVAPVPEPSPPAQPPAMSLEVRMTPPHLPNGAYERCVRVVENPFMLFGQGLNPAPSQTPKWFTDRGQPVPTANSFDKFYGSAQNSAFIYENGIKVNKGLIPGATVCAYQLDPPEKDAWDYIVDAVNFVGWVWDMYVTVWDMMKSWVADVLAYASGCVTLAQASGKSKEKAEELCSGLAKSAINYTLMAFGIPPTMPKFKDLAELGKGEFAEWAVKVIAEKGIIDCGLFQAQCEKMAKDLLDELLDEMQVVATQAATQSAMTGSQWVLYIHPGIYVIPEPAGTVSPAIFEIKVTRSTAPGAPAPPASCTYTGSVLGTKAHYEWYDYVAKTTQKGPVSGAVMKSGSVTMNLSNLKPGESMTSVLVLDKLLEWYPEGQDPNGYKGSTYYIYVKPQTWIFFVAYTQGAAFTTTEIVTSIGGGPACGSAAQSHLQDNLATEPWEIPS